MFYKYLFFPGMNAAVRAVVRMGLYVGAKVYFIHEVSPNFVMIIVYVPLAAAHSYNKLRAVQHHLR